MPVQIRQLVMFVCGVLLFSLLNGSPALHAETRTSESPEKRMLAGQLFKFSNSKIIMKIWIRSLIEPGAFKSYGYPHEIESRMEKNWRTAVLGSFRVSEILKEAQVEYAEAFSVAELKKLLSLAKSPLGQKIHAIEKALYGRDVIPSTLYAEQAVALKLMNEDPTRKKMIKEIARLQRLTAGAVNLHQNMTLALWLGTEGTKPASQPRLSPKQIFLEVEKLRPRTTRDAKPLILSQTALLYLSLELSELQEIKRFSASPFGQKLAEVSAKIWDRVIRKQMLAVGSQFTREWNQLNP